MASSLFFLANQKPSCVNLSRDMLSLLSTLSHVSDNDNSLIAITDKQEVENAANTVGSRVDAKQEASQSNCKDCEAIFRFDMLYWYNLE
jgi:hypothetical protein